MTHAVGGFVALAVGWFLVWLSGEFNGFVFLFMFYLGMVLYGFASVLLITEMQKWIVGIG